MHVPAMWDGLQQVLQDSKLGLRRWVWRGVERQEAARSGRSPSQRDIAVDPEESAVQSAARTRIVSSVSSTTVRLMKPQRRGPKIALVLAYVKASNQLDGAAIGWREREFTDRKIPKDTK
jgi:hypothetical protein